MLAVLGAALKDRDKVFGVFAESSLLLSSAMKRIGKPRRIKSVLSGFAGE
jgi:hypothetical protein